MRLGWKIAPVLAVALLLILCVAPAARAASQNAAPIAP
jgi:hypothetical protein